MTRIIIAATALLLSFSAVNAQEKQGTDKNFKRHGKGEFSQNLNLTEEQKAQVKIINEEFRKRAQDLKKNDGLNMGEFKKQSTALKQEHKQRIDALLTAEQKKQVIEAKQKGKEKGQQMSSARLNKMQEQLSLSDEQVTKLAASQEGIRSKIKAIHKNASLSPEEKKQQSKQLMQQQKESLKSVLTQEQLAKMRSMHKNKEIKK